MGEGRKIYKTIEISCRTSVNITKKIEEKLNNYGPLIRHLQIMCPHYKFKMVSIVIGALGYVPKCLEIISIKLVLIRLKQKN